MMNSAFGGSSSRHVGYVEMLGRSNLIMVVNTPDAVPSRFDGSGREISQDLPPYCRRGCVPVEDLNTLPSNWARSEANILSYALGITGKCGMWLDFNQCRNNVRDVAIQIDVQGLDPITGLKAGGGLEQYRETCPNHRSRLLADRTCTSCGFAWPPQNYLATTALGPIWLDGFRLPDGSVRQWVFDAASQGGVASNILGDGEDRFYVAARFFLSARKKQIQAVRTRGLVRTRGAASGPHMKAGAKIRQIVAEDLWGLDYWDPEPELTVIVNYTWMATLKSLIGSSPRGETDEGYLRGQQVGN